MIGLQLELEVLTCSYYKLFHSGWQNSRSKVSPLGKYVRIQKCVICWYVYINKIYVIKIQNYSEKERCDRIRSRKKWKRRTKKERRKKRFVFLTFTNIRILEISRICRNPTICQSSLIRPLICVLCFPRPLYPSLTTILIRYDLCLPILPQKSLVVCTKGRCFPSEAITTSNEG